MNPLLRMVCIASAVILYSSSAVAGIGSLRDRWTRGSQIGVCFFGGSPEARRSISAIASEWTKGIGVSFDFGNAPNFESCDAKIDYDVRVSLVQGGNWSYIGTQARLIAQSKATVNLEGLQETVGDSARSAVLQDFGHVLGLLHQEQDPRAGCRSQLDLDYFRKLGFSDEMVYQLLAPVKEPIFVSNTDQQTTMPNDGQYISTPFDKQSVMRLLVDPRMFREGERSPCYGAEVRELSDDDHRLAKLLYPPSPPDVSYTSESKQMTIRFEGLLAPEHFGYVVSALYDRQKIRLRKYVALDQRTIGEVVAAEGLAPRGMIPESLEAFLCRVNPHICRFIGARAVWSNVQAKLNYLDENIPCGDPSLPKVVFCIPNIRLASYPLVLSIKYDASRGSLAQIVVDRFRGCRSWNEECRTLVRRLNQQYNFDSNLKSILPRSFSGNLRLPSEGYRLVIEYHGPVDRDEIERTVSDVVDMRAQQLKVSRDEIAIQITYPIGEVKAQISQWAHEPVSGYVEPLKVMSYPYIDDAAWAELQHYRPVQAGTWDFRVDEKHCDLGGTPLIVHPTLTDSPIATPPPTRASHCGDEHSADYKPIDRYDHATAIAGLLSARVNGIGIAGIFPGLKLWTWEVLNGDQFNQAGDPLASMYLQFDDLDPLVINISQTYNVAVQGKPTNLENIMFGTPQRAGMHNSILFVAAAGLTTTDDGEVGAKIDTVSGSACASYPACWSNVDGGTRGLISVVALNAAGDDVLKNKGGQPISNYGLAFDVAAVGEVKTTMHGDFVGTMLGSSFAAPYVTGEAALIQAKAWTSNMRPTPLEVKQRILFTTDEPQSLNGVSRYGRINFAQALAFQDDRMRWEPSATCLDDPCWTSVKVNRDLKESLTIKSGQLEGTDNAANRHIPLSDVRRIRRDENNLYTVIFVEGRSLKKIINADIEVGEAKVVVLANNKKIKFVTTGLMEYVSCSFFPYCYPAR